MNPPQTDSNADLIEAIAEVEHEQWMHWSQAVAANVPDATRAKWRRSWVNYAELADDMKEADRIWARKILMILRKRGLIP